MPGEITFGATITGGIQNIAGLLPLLGTQQCEENIGSALTKGYLYAAAAPMSIFGSLGVARAGLKTFIACMSSRSWSGARILANMGFEAKGINLSLIMVDRDDKFGRHLAETRLDELVKELHIDPSRVTVSHKCARWNVTMVLLTAFLSSMSVIPYIHINHGGSDLTHFSQWTFPILRAVGGFLTASMMQIVIQRRIDSLTANRLATLNASEKLGCAGGSPGKMPGKTTSTERHPVVDDTPVRHASDNSGTGDVEKGLGVPGASDPGDTRPTESKPANSILTQHETAREHPLDWIYLFLLLIGILSSVTGYVGCFSVVQNAKLSTGPLSWLGLEAGLSVIRMMLWGLNPKGDDAPPLELILKLDHDTLLPTCNLDDAHILQGKVLALARANPFLNMITSFAGLVERFTHPDLTLYYTLTRKQDVDGAERSDAAGKRVLYVTIFDHKERTTRVYTRDGTVDCFYSTESDVPFIDLRHGLLETTLSKEITRKDDLIAGDPEIRSLLQKHYQSIMDQIHFTLGETSNAPTPTSLSPLPAYAIENKWTLKAADTMGASERTRLEDLITTSRRTWASTVEAGRNAEVDRSQPTFTRDCLYFDLRRIEEMRQSLDATRGVWIDLYMILVTRQCDAYETTAMRRVDGELVSVAGQQEPDNGNKDKEMALNTFQHGLIDERFLMEKLLVLEVEAWEGLVWNRVKEFVDRNDMSESGKEQLTREWRGNCWKRLDTNIRAMDTRMERAKEKLSAFGLQEMWGRLWNVDSALKHVHHEIRRAWQSAVERLVDAPTPSVSSSSTLTSRLNEDVQRLAQRIDNGLFPSRQKQERTQHQEATYRLQKELTDVEFRIGRGLDSCGQILGRFDLWKCRHSRSRDLWLQFINESLHTLHSHSRALKVNNDVISIRVSCDSDEEYAWFAETICDLPSITSIRVNDCQRLPPIQRNSDTPLLIYDRDSHYLETFLNNDSSLNRTRDTYVFVTYTYGCTIAVSFFGPSSGNLILRFKHLSYEDETFLTVPNTSFNLPIPDSLIVDDINLYPIGNSSTELSFTPNTRNNLIFLIFPLLDDIEYILYDLQLLDEDGNPYGQPSPRNIPATSSALNALITPYDPKSKDSKL